MVDEMTVEEKYKRILKILGVRNQIIVAQAEKIFQLEGREELENPPPKEATQNEVLAYDIGKERFVHRDD